MKMTFEHILDKPHQGPIIIAGPCSAETEEQVMVTARQLSKQNIDLPWEKASDV